MSDHKQAIDGIIYGVKALKNAHQEHLAAAAAIEASLASMGKELRALGIEEVAALPRIDGRTPAGRAMKEAAPEPILTVTVNGEAAE